MADYKKVKRKEFERFLEKYPRILIKHTNMVSEPPPITYHDSSLGSNDEAVVAFTLFYDEPSGKYYKPEKDRDYFIIK